MIQIAIVDDEPIAIDQITAELSKIEKDISVSFEIKTYTNVQKLLNDFSSLPFDAIFLDLDMPEKSGFEISSIIRTNGNEIPIIYITNRDDLMQQAFQYKILGFVRKNNLEKELPFAVACVLQEIQKNAQYITVESLQKQQKKQYKLHIPDIIYIESLNHLTQIYLNDNSACITTRNPLYFYLEQPQFQNFIQIASSCIVNYAYIFSIEKEQLVLKNGKRLHMSRRKIAEVKEKFLHLSRRSFI